MHITKDFCRLWECASNPDNCGYYPKDCAIRSLYISLDKVVTKTSKYVHLGVSQSLSNSDIKEAVKLLSIIERMSK